MFCHFILALTIVGIYFLINIRFIPSQFSVYTLIQINLDLTVVGCALYYFFKTGYSLGFTLLLVCLMYKFQLTVLNNRLTRLVANIKRVKKHFFINRNYDHLFSVYLIAHRSIMTSLDLLNKDIFSSLAASVMTFATPYNIYLLTTLLYTADPSAKLMIDQVGVVFSVVYQVLVITLVAVALCRLIDQLHISSKTMHGLQLWLISSCVDKRIQNLKIFKSFKISLTFKWKLAVHYETVHAIDENKLHFTVGSMILSKKSVVEVIF